ncbi:hypothetical protein DL89DRAFT_294457 [Linderina pennispora]|uniref:Galactose oxidase n=1 Tax=Linderina pennispora TaxID=61395 RepID=A0A1Y1W303_9FUNG|nr:uncharacterized protein DL89DRAFT_294457 [Linderina pennispora]ORX67919.1 hypothetical protein DL89DRAFT_294457 [Linderina pennispora]
MLSLTTGRLLESESTSQIPLVAGHTLCSSDDSNMLIVFGGDIPDRATYVAPLYVYSTGIDLWRAVNETGFPKPLVNHTTVLQKSTGDMLIFGGSAWSANSNELQITNSTFRMRQATGDKSNDGGKQPNNQQQGDFQINRSFPLGKGNFVDVSVDFRRRQDSYTLSRRGLDGLNVGIMSWINQTLPKSVAGRVGHTASLVSDRYMVVLGGRTRSGSMVGLDVLYVYDMLARTWTRRTSSGDAPKKRQAHIAAVVNDTMIVVHGGTNTNSSAAFGDIAVLDTQTWTWSTPSLGHMFWMMFGYVSDAASADKGLYILDTSTWQFTNRFSAARSGLEKNHTYFKVSGWTIFGLLVSSVVGLFVILILMYIAYMHYYNRHPRLSESGDGEILSPTTELRSLGRKLTAKLGTQRSKKAQQEQQKQKEEREPLGTKMLRSNFRSHDPRLSAQSGPAISLSNGRAVGYSPGGDDTSLHIMFDLSRESSFERGLLPPPAPTLNTSLTPDSRELTASGTRLSRRVHLDNVEMPGGLRNRDFVSGFAGLIDDSVSIPDSENFRGSVASGTSGTSDGQWSRTDNRRNRRNKSKHVSAMLPRIVGSRLTLPPESATALARYRFEELEETPDGVMPPPKTVSGYPGDETPQASIAMLSAGRDSVSDAALAPPVMPAAYQDAGSMKSRSSNGSDSDVRSSAGSQEPSMRDSIDIFAVMNRINGQGFYVANPDNS